MAETIYNFEMSANIEVISEIVNRLSGIPKNESLSKEESLFKGLEEIERKINFLEKEQKNTTKRINEILTVIMSLMNSDYKKKAVISKKRNDFDALALGVNMLGDELQTSTISLIEKEVVIKEIHHRIKNNLQIISSLLNLQSEKVSGLALEAFTESKNRIKAMALVHEKLYHSKDLVNIDMKEYIESFLSYMNNTYNLNPEKVHLNTKIELSSPYLDLDTAIPCALILNELISNSCKYAFPDHREGNISLYLTMEEENPDTPFYILEVSDDGVGIQKNIDLAKTDSLGLQLVTILTSQIDGKLELSRNNGTRFSLRFPAKKRKK
jgi:two-component sensor histidine kinase